MGISTSIRSASSTFSAKLGDSLEHGMHGFSFPVALHVDISFWHSLDFLCVSEIFPIPKVFRSGRRAHLCLPARLYPAWRNAFSNLTFTMGSRALTISFYRRSRLRSKLPFCGLHVYRGQPSRSMGWVGVT